MTPGMVTRPMTEPGILVDFDEVLLIARLLTALGGLLVAWYAWDTRHLIEHHLKGQSNTCPKPHHHGDGWNDD